MQLSPIRTATLVATLFAASAQAAVVFSDAFDSDRPVSEMNVDDLVHWTIGNGTVDYLRSGDSFAITCAGGGGGCLDMDGTSDRAGRITSRRSFTFDPGTGYVLDVWVSGNQLGGADDAVRFGLVNDAGDEFARLIGPIASNDPFHVFSLAFAGAAHAGSWRLFAEGLGGDMVGAILDDVVLRDVPASTVPEPATWLMAGAALALAGRMRRPPR
jgi:hypothetical protein